MGVEKCVHQSSASSFLLKINLLMFSAFKTGKLLAGRRAHICVLTSLVPVPLYFFDSQYDIIFYINIIRRGVDWLGEWAN